MSRFAPFLALVLLAACAPASESMTLSERRDACEDRGCFPSCDALENARCTDRAGDTCADCEAACEREGALEGGLCFAGLPACAGSRDEAPSCYLR